MQINLYTISLNNISRMLFLYMTALDNTKC